jgi:hypothetical protein
MEILYSAYRTLREAAEFPRIFDPDNEIYLECYLLGQHYSLLADELKRNGFELPISQTEKLDLLRRLNQALSATIGEIEPMDVSALARAAGENLLAEVRQMISEHEANE